MRYIKVSWPACEQAELQKYSKVDEVFWSDEAKAMFVPEEIFEKVRPYLSV